ncbi:sensor histidine kinase [Robertkochia solimangrovi]|uniref:sensor histidine kinase n=1 Tax=Robertkochia solimangrovi TaxID=2213046 RepID=UPI0011816213|nr:histidine kinase [Robertkochia solimangrovi]TRZ45283.1 hypothetical protein DMZ48_05930 [Robertkochia solimangrovi]
MTKNQRIVLYSICILLFLFGFDLLNSLNSGKPIVWTRIFNYFILTQLLYISAIFWLSYMLWNNVWPRRKWYKIVGVILFLFTFFISFRYVIEEVISPLVLGHGNYFEGVSFQYYVSDNLYYASIYIVVGFLLFLLDYQIRLQKEKAELEITTKNAELDFLKLQVSPHFLFNALNSIYGLAYKKSDHTHEAILQLSNLMRYMLYEKNQMVSLDKEWEMLEDFIALQAIRLNLPLQLDIQKNGDTSPIMVPPYLLITFVENAFKHGKLTGTAMPFKILLEVKNNNVHFISENSNGKINKDEQKGIGLDNIKKRLELLYPNRHTLKIDQSEAFYKIDLTLQGNEN